MSFQDSLVSASHLPQKHCDYSTAFPLSHLVACHSVFFWNRTFFLFIYFCDLEPQGSSWLSLPRAGMMSRCPNTWVFPQVLEPEPRFPYLQGKCFSEWPIFLACHWDGGLDILNYWSQMPPCPRLLWLQMCTPVPNLPQTSTEKAACLCAGHWASQDSA